MAQQAVDIAGAETLALPHAGVELLQHLARRYTCLGRPRQGDDVAMHVRLDAEPILEQGEMAVVRTEQATKMAVVLERHDHACLLDFERLGCTRRRWPAHASQLGGLRKVCSCPNPYFSLAQS